MSTKHSWTPEKLQKLTTDKLTGIQAQAVKLGVPDLASICDAELLARITKSAQAKSSANKTKSGGVVTEYHFVCSNSRGVLREADGSFRTGSWVVAEGLVQASLKNGATVALHESKAESSCLQGTLLGYRLAPRDMIDKYNVGIEFHVGPGTIGSMSWVGDGAGEKGYRWQ